MHQAGAAPVTSESKIEKDPALDPSTVLTEEKKLDQDPALEDHNPLDKTEYDDEEQDEFYSPNEEAKTHYRRAEAELEYLATYNLKELEEKYKSPGQDS